MQTKKIKYFLFLAHGIDKRKDINKLLNILKKGISNIIEIKVYPDTKSFNYYIKGSISYTNQKEIYDLEKYITDTFNNYKEQLLSIFVKSKEYQKILMEITDNV